VKIKYMLALVLCSYSLPSAQPIPRGEREILQLQDQRSLGEGKLIAYLSDKNTRLRYRAGIALANIQDSSVVLELTKALNDHSANVRSAAAFALGQIGTGQAGDVLLSALKKEKNATARTRITEAIGKIGSEQNLDSLLSFITRNPQKIPDTDFAMCLARFAIRKIKTERSIWKCFELVQKKSSNIRSAGLFALWRSAPHGLIDLEISNEREKFLLLSKDKDPLVRMHLASLLARTKSKDALELLNALEQTEQTLNDWHVWVQIIRARATIGSSEIDFLERNYQYLGMDHEYLKITALQSLTSVSSLLLQSAEKDSICQRVLNYAHGSSGWSEAVRGEAFVTLGKHFPVQFEQYYYGIQDTTFTTRLRVKLLEGISQQINNAHLTRLLIFMNNESPSVAMAAADFIKPMLISVAHKKLDYDSMAEARLFKTVFENSAYAMSRKDRGLTTVVAGLFADTVLARMFSIYNHDSKIVDLLITSFETLKNSDDAEAKQSILQALEHINDKRVIPFYENVLSDSNSAIAGEAAASLHRLTGKDYSSQMKKNVIPEKTTEDWKILESIPPHQRALIKTTKGDIVLELMKEQAPFTVLNFVKLTRKQFYHGLIFHRVVPDFVVQGGDPRGDGWGGPGYTIRTEVSWENYERGSCGMASAGKDTEGCQFFITHIPTPHLDGRYTNFAKVIKGMDVVDCLQIGDTILSIQIAQ
jgi:cyclophilin family peptidyl-prolyl cis-trans isomerase/HEAT repeat protein